MEEPKIFFDSDGFEFMDASYQVTARETRYIAPIILEVNRQKSVLQNKLPTKQLHRGAKEWIEEIADEGEPPIFDDNFLTEDQAELRKQSSTFYPVYMHHDFRLAMSDVDAVQYSQYHNMSLDAQTIRNLTASMVEFKEKVLWRGYDIAGRANAAANNQGVIDTSSLGILNTSGINTFDAGAGNDANVTAAGDGPASLADAAGALITDDYYGPYDMYMTPLVYAALLENQNSTTTETDIQLMRRSVDIDGNKLLKSMSVTKHLLNTAETAANGAMCVIDPKDQKGQPTVMIGEAYPVMSVMDARRAAVAASGKIIWAGIAGVIRPEAVASETSIASS